MEKRKPNHKVVWERKERAHETTCGYLFMKEEIVWFSEVPVSRARQAADK